MGWRFAGGGGGGAETDPVASPLASDAQAAADTAQTGADASAKKDQNLTDLTSASAARTAIGVPATADVMLKADSLAGIASASAGRSALALGTAALADTGTGPGDVPVLDGSGRMPAVDGSQMTNLPGGATTLAVAQTAHGFAVGDAIRRGSGSYAEAEADSAANAEVVGIVTAVAGANNFTFQPVGPVITGLSGLTDGETYFLDPATPGVITATEPTGDGEISKPVLIAISTTSGVLLGMRGMVVGGEAPGGGLAADDWSSGFDSNLGSGAGETGYVAAGWTAGTNGTYTDQDGYTRITGTAGLRHIYRGIPAAVDWTSGEWELRVRMRVNPGTQSPAIYVHTEVGDIGLWLRFVPVAGPPGWSQLTYINTGGSEPALGSGLPAYCADDSAVTVTARRVLFGVDTALNGGVVEFWIDEALVGRIPFALFYVTDALFAGLDGDSLVRIGAPIGDAYVSSQDLRIYRVAMRAGLNAAPPSYGLAADGGW